MLGGDKDLLNATSALFPSGATQVALFRYQLAGCRIFVPASGGDSSSPLGWIEADSAMIGDTGATPQVALYVAVPGWQTAMRPHQLRGDMERCRHILPQGGQILVLIQGPRFSRCFWYQSIPSSFREMCVEEFMVFCRDGVPTDIISVDRDLQALTLKRLLPKLSPFKAALFRVLHWLNLWPNFEKAHLYRFHG